MYMYPLVSFMKYTTFTPLIITNILPTKMESLDQTEQKEQKAPENTDILTKKYTEDGLNTN